MHTVLPSTSSTCQARKSMRSSATTPRPQAQTRVGEFGSLDVPLPVNEWHIKPAIGDRKTKAAASLKTWVLINL